MGWTKTEITEEKAEELLRREVELYDQYLTGIVFTFARYTGGVLDEDRGGGCYYGYDYMASGLLPEAFAGEERAKGAKKAGSTRKALNEALERSRMAFEAAAHATCVKLPNADRPGSFAEFPFQCVADAREFLKPWYPNKEAQDSFIQVKYEEV